MRPVTLRKKHTERIRKIEPITIVWPRIRNGYCPPIWPVNGFDL
jgi:hypothetical protein